MRQFAFPTHTHTPQVGGKLEGVPELGAGNEMKGWPLWGASFTKNLTFIIFLTSANMKACGVSSSPDNFYIFAVPKTCAENGFNRKKSHFEFLRAGYKISNLTFRLLVVRTFHSVTNGPN